MKQAYVFPGQGAQFSGMGKELYENHSSARDIFEQANDILGFRITEVMFAGSDEDLRQTKVTQPAIFIHSIAVISTIENFKPDMVAGHSLGEFSALVANKCLSFADGLKLVNQRAQAMQYACEVNPGTMAAVLGLDDRTVERICQGITDEIVVAANYNCPGQLVISGSLKGIEFACELMKSAGAKRALPLQVGGAFHSPLMSPAKEKLKTAIASTTFHEPICPVYQNVNAKPSVDPDVIKQNLIDQLTSPVRWTQSVLQMASDGAGVFIEAGPGKVLQGLIKKIAPDVEVKSA